MAETRQGNPFGKALLATAGLVAGAFVVRGAIQRAGRAKAHLAEGIDEKTWITLGGLDQWVTIRGRSLDNPLMLVLHGGPGSAMSPFAHMAYPHWEDYFTVVNWDQRGAGRTFGRHGRKGSGQLTVGRLVVDGVELAQELRRRFPDRPLVLLGISWGSLLGVEMIRARPDLFAAYVGAGQVVDMGRGEALSYFGTVDRLRAKGEERKAQTLEAIGPPPYPDIKALRTQRKLLVSTMPAAERRVFRSLPLQLLLGPESKLKDLADFRGGMKFTIGALWGQLRGWRLADGGLAFAPPMVFLQGDLDLQTPTALVTELAPRLEAPTAELVVFEGAGHMALITHADAFRRTLVEKVLPLLAARPKRKPRKKRA
ncbi:MAG TPA: alpha/beta hydrolase [Phenylobacterium sp.]|jgi:pimeloyl-ACP methyl ester carboxylesterase|nr:alpha/beta hydrolase [Phenylobacterium sp.]